jgi:hypothetical protein
LRALQAAGRVKFMNSPQQPKDHCGALVDEDFATIDQEVHLPRPFIVECDGQVRFAQGCAGHLQRVNGVRLSWRACRAAGPRGEPWLYIYGIGPDAAFDILKWRSQDANVRLRAFAEQLVADVLTLNRDEGSPLSRPTFDQLLLTAHERVKARGAQAHARGAL